MKKIKIPIIVLSVIISSFIYITDDQRVKKIKEKLEEYSESKEFPDIFIHTDRDKYTAGNNIWFKAYLTNPFDNSYFNADDKLYVELRNSSDQIIYTRIAKIENGTAAGDFISPDTLKDGSYSIRAYTAVSGNNNGKLSFSKNIYISNYTKEYIPFSNKKMLKTYKKNSTDYSINFFPEGGSLVNGIESIIAFKAINLKNCPLQLPGVLHTLELQ